MISEEEFQNKQRKYQQAAVILFIPAILSTAILVLWYALGPKTGMETLAIIIPWLMALLVHAGVTVPAIFFVFKSRAHIKLSWIYVYFFFFWAIHAGYYVMTSGLDVAVQKKIHSVQKPRETELVARIDEMYDSRSGGRDPGSFYVSKVEKLLSAGANVNYIPPGTQFPMICNAARINSPELIKLLVSHGADVEGGVHPSSSPLMRAVRQGHSDVVAVLLELGANPDLSGYNPHTPLMVAVKEKDIRTVSVMLEKGARPDVHPRSSISALQIAAGNADAETMGLLLKAGADPDEMSFGWSTAMIRSVMEGCTACVKELIQAGGKAVGHTPDKQGVLMLAWDRELGDILALFKEAPDINTPGDRYQEETFDDLFRAVRQKKWEALELFLDIGVPADIRNKDQRNLLQVIASRNYGKPVLPETSEIKATKILLKRGADPDTRDKDGRTPLLLAIQSGATDLAYCLLDHGANANQTTAENYSPLHYAIQRNEADLVQRLLTVGADPNTLTKLGMNSSSVLDDSVKKGNAEIVKMLLEYGAVPDLTRTSGANMIRHAVSFPVILQLLVEHGLDLSKTDAFTRYPISYALDTKYREALEIMISAGSPLFLKDWQGQQPLYFCAEKGYTDIMRKALNRNDVMQDNKTYLQNCLRRAVRHGRTRVVSVLIEKGVRLEYDSELDTLLHYANPPKEDPQALENIRALFRK